MPLLSETCGNFRLGSYCLITHCDSKRFPWQKSAHSRQFLKTLIFLRIENRNHVYKSEHRVHSSEWLMFVRRCVPLSQMTSPFRSISVPKNRKESLTCRIHRDELLTKDGKPLTDMPVICHNKSCGVWLVARGALKRTVCPSVGTPHREAAPVINYLRYEEVNEKMIK